jgi:transcriptional regulator with PAS, ATPase and Fis domain
MKKEWLDFLDAALTVCDKNGTIVYMNRKSEETFIKDGGKKLLGKNLEDCHPPKAAEKIKEMLLDQNENIYTIEKAGKRKIIIQKPVYDNDAFDGLIEISIELPREMQHFKRD